MSVTQSGWSVFIPPSGPVPRDQSLWLFRHGRPSDLNCGATLISWSLNPSFLAAAVPWLRETAADSHVHVHCRQFVCVQVSRNSMVHYTARMIPSRCL